MSFFRADLQEQETTILVDYYARIFKIYTNRYQTYKRIQKRIGEPNEKFYVKGELCGATWVLSFSQRHLITSILSCPVLIGNMR